MEVRDAAFRTSGQRPADGFAALENHTMRTNTGGLDTAPGAAPVSPTRRTPTGPMPHPTRNTPFRTVQLGRTLSAA